jgi:hypothetical protein
MSEQQSDDATGGIVQTTTHIHCDCVLSWPPAAGMVEIHINYHPAFSAEDETERARVARDMAARIQAEFRKLGM